MWWKLVLKVAVAAGLDKWAKDKAFALVSKLRSKAAAKAQDILAGNNAKVKDILEAGGASGEEKTEEVSQP